MGDAYQRGILLYRHQRYEMAANEFRQQINLDPRGPAAYAMLGLALCNQKKRNEAEVEIRRGIEINPQFAFLFYALSLVQLLPDGPIKIGYRQNRQQAERTAYHRRLTESRISLRMAIDLNPNNADFFAQLSAVEFDICDLKSALLSAERALALAPEHKLSADMRARILDRMGYRDEALLAVDGSLQAMPENANAHTTRGWFLLRRGRAARALQHFQEALRISPNEYRALKGLKIARSAAPPYLGAPRRIELFLSEGNERLLVFWTLWSSFVVYTIANNIEMIRPLVTLPLFAIIPVGAALLFKLMIMTARQVRRWVFSRRRRRMNVIAA